MTIEKETPSLAEEISVIHAIAARGSGTPENPIRRVHQYWSKEGVLLAEKDDLEPCPRCGHLTAGELVGQVKKKIWMEGTK